jgi:hypothetical protein
LFLVILNNLVELICRTVAERPVADRVFEHFPGLPDRLRAE